MRITIPSFLRHQDLRNATIFSGILFVIAFFRVYLPLKNINHLLVIHLTGIPGSTFSGTKSDIYALLLIGFVIMALNVAFIHAFFRRERFFSYLFAIVNIIFVSLLLIAIAGIMTANAI
jgi:hypothetical protein